MEGIIVFMATVLAVAFLSYRLGFIRGVRTRIRHQITPTHAGTGQDAGQCPDGDREPQPHSRRDQAAAPGPPGHRDKTAATPIGDSRSAASTPAPGDRSM